MKYVIFFFSVLLVAGCTTSEPTIREQVVGTIRSAELPPTPTPMFTIPTAGGGVGISTSAGEGKRAVTLTAGETRRLIDGIETALDNWPRGSSVPAFRNTVMFGAADTNRRNPFSVDMVKTPAMPEPVLLVSVAYIDSFAYLAIDEENSRRWAKRLRAASGN
jgi:hypothetical protein